MHESVSSFVARISTGVEELLTQAGFEGASVSWMEDRREKWAEDLLWWSCGVGTGPVARIFAGADREAWEELGRVHETAQGSAPENDFAALVAPVRKAAVERFGSDVSAEDAEPAAEPPREWPAAVVSIQMEDRSLQLYLAVNPELADTLGAPAEEPVPAEWNGPSGPIDMLLHIELPVSVSLGRTKMRIKDLLSVTNGSIVELDQELEDEVEIRVNNCTIARGEVVSVGGNYGVRILEMVTSGNGKGLARLKGTA
jgi:flagellar motor switch protein FliN/FliY